MSLAPMDQLSGESKAWVFGASKPLDDHHDLIRETMARFVSEWTAHGADLPAAYEIIDGRFLVVAADDAADPGGCSIDRLFDLMRAFERQFGVAMLDSTLVFYRDQSGSICSASRPEFRQLVEKGEVHADTIVFDTSIDRLADMRDGRWETAAANSWHGSAFGLK